MDWMSVALALAHRGARQGEVPVGAVLVHHNRLVASMHNMSHRWNIPFAHAEILALLQGHKKLETRYLAECDLYVTLEPCPLCKSAIRMSHLRHLYFGAYAPVGAWKEKELHLTGGFQETTCEALLKSFFSDVRLSPKIVKPSHDHLPS